MSRSTRFPALFALLLIAIAAVDLIGNQRVGLWDRDEPWYAQCSREMIQSGDWVVPRFLGQLRIEKPPMVYWLQMAAMRAVGDGPQNHGPPPTYAPAAARFPSTCAVVLTALLLGLTVKKFAGSRRALWTVLIFGSCGVSIAAAKFCITDATLMFFIVTGQICLAVIYAAAVKHQPIPRWAAPLFWATTGLAGLTKGPQAIGMHAMTLAILIALDTACGKSWRWIKHLNPVLGLPILAAVVTPWLIEIHLRAPGFLHELIHRAQQHAGSSMEGHGEPPGYHLLLMFATFFPWSLLLPTALVMAWRHRHRPTIRFGFAAFAGPWLLMELVTTKLPFYILPAFAGLSFLTADALVCCQRKKIPDLRNRAFLVGVVVWSTAVFLITAAAIVPVWRIKNHWPYDPFPFLFAGILYALIVYSLWRRQAIAAAAAGMGIGMWIMILILYTTIFPNQQIIRLSQRLVADLQSLHATGRDTRILMIGFNDPSLSNREVGYNEPSLSYYQGGGAVPAEASYFSSTPPAQWPRWFIITEYIWKLHPALADQYTVRASETGIDYNGGGLMTVLVVERNRDILP